MSDLLLLATELRTLRLRLDRMEAQESVAPKALTAYALLAGRSGGQTLIGGTAASNNLTLQSTSNATRGDVIIGDPLLLSGASASRLLATDANKRVVSVDNLTAWVAGTTNRVTVSSDGDGSITLSGPQDIHTTASPQFTALWLGTSAITDAAQYTVRSQGAYGFVTHRLVRATGGGAGDLFTASLYNSADTTETRVIRIGVFGSFLVSPPSINYAYISNTGAYDNATIKIRNNNLVGINIAGTSNPLAALHVVGTLAVDGDDGGVAGTVGFTDVSDLAARSTGVGTIKFDDTTNRDSAGFIKIYIGTTAYYIPVFAAI